MRFTWGEAAWLYLIAYARAQGYNETNYLGMANFGSATSLSFSSGPLTILGVGFGGQVDSNGNPYSFANWVNKATCTIGSSPSQTGLVCIQSAVGDATFSAANAIQSTNAANYPNLQNTVLIKTGYCQGWYSGHDIGQGPSCNSASDPDNAYPPQGTSCPNIDGTTTPSCSQYTFAARGVKVTCKNTCNSNTHAYFNQSTFYSLIAQVVQSMYNNNLWAARIAVTRGTNYVDARCRITIPDLTDFPPGTSNVCPDWIPGYGNTVLAVDTSLSPDS
ncbi:hypothetical protein ANO11243_080860 [Dothideomycetidae sp. 11243]|nr:hypothetical protein ANO11243_080860 [fungal sp. No.11243]